MKKTNTKYWSLKRKQAAIDINLILREAEDEKQ